MAVEQMCIIYGTFGLISSHLARFRADYVSRNDRFQAVFRTIILKVQVDDQCVK